MSSNQPGPYGGPPQQPGPYGRPGQSGPYGQQPQAPQPGYGYPQQAPAAPQPGYGHPQQTPAAPQPGYGHPQQTPAAPQPGYGHPQPPQPGYGYPQQGVPPQQPPYGQQPYGAPQPPPPAGGGKRTGLVIGAVAVVAAVAVGAYFVIGGGGGGGGGGDVADDGPHRLTTPATLLGDYEKSDSGTGGMSDSDLKDAEAWGVHDPKDVSAGYTSGAGVTSKNLLLSGVYGSVDDPEEVVDAMFAAARKDSDSSEGRFVGSPRTYTPAGFDNGVMKCQESQAKEGGQTLTIPFCIWGDHSTLAYVMSYDMASLAGGKGMSLADAAGLTAKVRNEVRVKA
ncbi:hypothetical protein QQY24_20780 [Streptomyces sp. TG1A-8]|uniref:hypothetical protein n=1 Tax=Streptomyces sp. TG1A-8 TaxID=3051385 RepID=UPI00265BC598|nr:hypothetical protein [Streptomyces sp. TG1A-8]MDO0927723.1 hypothetical protein [Streptomyces sp. TG1A-8]